MYSDIPKFVIFGISGRGKSTFLNYLLQGPEQAKKDPIFKTASGSGSCTMECFAVQKKIFGTEQEVKIIDTPGIFNADMKLDKWFNIMKAGIPSSFNALLWVINIKERTLTLDTMLIASLQLIINNFDFKDLIFVFTHCDYLDNDDPTPMECAQQWIADLNATVKHSVPGTHIVLFGKKKGDQYTPNYTNEVVSAVASFKSSPLHVADNLKLDKAFAMKLLDQIDDKIVPAVEEELKKCCYDEYTQVYLWDVKQEKMIQVAMREVKVGDLLLTLNQEPSGEFMCQLEPAIVVNRYQNMPGAARRFVKILTEGNEGKRELKLHENHFIHVMREGKHICIIAKEVQHDDLLYIVDFNLGSTKPVQHHNMPKTVQIKSISYCQEGEISGPMNIRTPSLNLVVNDIWGSSKFNPDSGVVGHALVRLAARIHPSGGQKLQNLAHFLQLHRFLSP